MGKKLLALLLAAVMVLSLAACNSSAPAETEATKAEEQTDTTAADEKADDTTAAPAEETDAPEVEDETPAEGGEDAPAGSGDAVWDEAWADVDTSEHVVINYMTTGDAPTTGCNDEMLAQLNKILTDRVNAEINIYWISWTDYLANYNLTLARMDGSVDLVGSATDWLDAWPNAKNGAFLELSEEDLAKYAPKTWASVPAEHWDYCKYDGEIYFMPEDNYSQWTNHGFCYRLDWAREAGLADGVKSWEDLTTYFKYVKENYGDDLIALWDTDGTSYPAGGYITSHTDWTSLNGICSGALWGAYDSDEYTVKCEYLEETDNLVAFAEMMKEWDEIGVWPTDVLSNTGADNRLEFRQGKTAVEQHHTQTWTGIVSPKASTDNTMYIDDPDAEVGFFYYGMESKNVKRDLITHGVCAISAASKNPERALMVYDLLRNDADCYDLFNYGIKGRSYDVDENGMRFTPDSYVADKDSISTNWWWGRNDDLEIPSASMNWDAINALYDEYESFAKLYPWENFVPEMDAIQSYVDNCQEVYTKYMKLICYGQYDGEPADMVAEFQQALRDAGAEKVTEALQEQFDAFYGK